MLKQTVINKQWGFFFLLFFLHKSEHYPQCLWQVNKQSSREGIEESGGGEGGSLLVNSVLFHSLNTVRLSWCWDRRGSCGLWQAWSVCMQWIHSETCHRPMNRRGWEESSQLNQYDTSQQITVPANAPPWPFGRERLIWKSFSLFQLPVSYISK